MKGSVINYWYLFLLYFQSFTEENNNGLYKTVDVGARG